MYVVTRVVLFCGKLYYITLSVLYIALVVWCIEITIGNRFRAGGRGGVLFLTSYSFLSDFPSHSE